MGRLESRPIGVVNPSTRGSVYHLPLRLNSRWPLSPPLRGLREPSPWPAKRESPRSLKDRSERSLYERPPRSAEDRSPSFLRNSFLKPPLPLKLPPRSPPRLPW